MENERDNAVTLDRLDNRQKKFRLNPSRKYGLISACSVLFVLIVWTVLCWLQIFPPLFLPSPATIMKQLYLMTVQTYDGLSLIVHLLVSLGRVMIGFLFAVIVGVPLGLLMGRSKVADAIINPFIQLYRPVPPLAYIPILIVWFGIGELPKMLLIFVGTVPIIIMNTLSGVRSVKESAIRAALALGATNGQLLRYVLLPAALPHIFAGMRVGVGIAWTCLVAAEMIAATSGLGWMILNASRYLRTDIIFVGILVIGIIGLLIDALLRLIEKWAVPWQGKY
jgi:ABC-type nitrate/sulfonate/bicarbonate transport system permease component